jgi:phage repressor protein C with HTH and peptisase S24 domain
MSQTPQYSTGQRFAGVLVALKALRRIKKESDVAMEAGYRPSTLSEIKADRQAPPEKILELLQNKFKVSTEFIISGAGNMFILDEGPRQTDWAVLEEDETKNYTSQRREKANSQSPFLVPFLPVKAQAGYVKAIDQEVYLDALEKYALPPGVSGHGAIWRYWEVEGDSMEPTFKQGDIVLTSFVHPMDWENLRNFYTYVIVTSDRVLIKRIFCKNPLEWVLISDNEDVYAQQLLPIEFIKEVWVYRKTWSTRAAPPKEFIIKV